MVQRNPALHARSDDNSGGCWLQVALRTLVMQARNDDDMMKAQPTLVSSLSIDTLNPNPDDVEVRLPDDSDARPGVLHSSLMSVSPVDFTSVEPEAAAVDDGVTDDVEDRGNGGDGCDEVPGVALPDDVNFALSCCLLSVHPQFTRLI